MHPDSIRLMTYFRDKYVKEGMTILDVGSMCINRTFKQTYRDVFKGFNYTGMDMGFGPNVDIVGYENIKIKYDVIVSGQVMEHMKRPWEWMKDLTNYFTQYICVIAPHGFSQHNFPIDTYRYFPEGMRDLFDYAGIKELEIVKDKLDTMGIGCLN